MRSTLAIVVAALIAAESHGQTFDPAQQIYQFTGNSTGNNQFNSITAQPTLATFSTFTRTTVTWANAANTFNSENWAVGGADVDPTRYTSFTLTPNPGQFLNLESLSFEHTRTGNGPANGEVRYSLDGFASSVNLAFATSTGNTSTFWNFPDISTSSPIEFRFFGYGAVNSAGAMRFDNVFLGGNASPVPEPGWIVGFCAAAGLAARFGRRLRRR